MLGRNDLCLCGSGKKYKKCCLKLDSGKYSKWKNNCRTLVGTTEQDKKISMIFTETYDFMMSKNWQGACHAISSIQYILLSEIGETPNLCIGEVGVGVHSFDHSWIELNGKVYDITIENGLEGVRTDAVINGCNINDLKPTQIVYGTGRKIDPPAAIIKDLTLGEYLDGFLNQPKSEILYFLQSGLWDIAVQIGKAIELNLDENELKSKYSEIKRIIK